MTEWMELSKEENEMMDIVPKREGEKEGHGSYSSTCHYHYFLYPLIVDALLLIHQDSLA